MDGYSLVYLFLGSKVTGLLRWHKQSPCHVILIRSSSRPPVNTSALVTIAMCNEMRIYLSRDANQIAIKPPGQHFHACRDYDVQQNTEHRANQIAIKTPFALVTIAMCNKPGNAVVLC